MNKVRKILLSTLCCSLVAVAGADTLDMRATQNTAGFDAPGKPSRGMTQTSVEASYGAPQSTVAAIGDPPISRWEYANFVVFFEYDRVIHAVSKR